MNNNIGDAIAGKRKIPVNVTLDVALKENLEKYKKKNNIEQLSPMINEMLWDWLNKMGELEKE